MSRSDASVNPSLLINRVKSEETGHVFSESMLMADSFAVSTGNSF